ncbi:hypothetical protein [Crateriforma spongiae]|uniref:hypothetical protein n=1 Tax=Crateriforma spongiae TaxID=2724528 RepID=UPI001445D46E|nr:hypothetical protein [Crateriforma spongiae]
MTSVTGVPLPRLPDHGIVLALDGLARLLSPTALIQWRPETASDTAGNENRSARQTIQ